MSNQSSNQPSNQSSYPLSKQLHFNAFQMLTPGANGQWRSDRNHRDHLSLRYWQDQATLLERAGFDAIFFADILGVFETRESGHELSVRDAHVFPLGDPFVLVSALASVTSKLGFVVTASTTYEPPFLLARRFSTLDHFTQGRVGWNIVTSYLDTAAANFGLDEQIDHDERYVRADEYIAVVEKLWLQSWDDDALVVDRAGGVYAEPGKVHQINHSGRYYSVRGPHSVEPSPQGKPVFFEASASEAGFDFAAKHAEGLYTQAGNIEKLRHNTDSVRERARAIGRKPEPRIFAAADIVVGHTTEEAREKARWLGSFASEESALAWNGIDIRKYPRDTLLSELATFGTTRPLRSVNGRHDVTIQEYIDHIRTKSSDFSFVGTPGEVADQLEETAEAAGLDGFSVGSGHTPGVYEDFAELLTPELRRRGVLPELADVSGTLRERLVG
ncbi:MAG TPA: NtaA/DmoA family FMN-dependent monooxygenase [Pseudonocardiaceae bacterium]